MGASQQSRKKLPHLQGIRALAIIAVTLFHFFPKYFSNGYLGVDIFFALSGYLMTMMLSHFTKIGPREIVNFLYRRIKRITPLYYFCTLGTLVALNCAASVSIKFGNIDPAKNALIFATNLIRPNNMKGYFEKLGAAVDLFTHTWSLAVEMQFYLLFPVIFIVYRALPYKYLSFGYLLLNSLISFFYYGYSDEFTSFNSVFARIWQFNAGMLVYTISNPSTSSDPSSDSLESAKLIDNESESCRILNSNAIYSLAVLVAIIISPQAIYPDFGRVLAIIITMQLFQHGGGFILLENRLLVHIGEVSYSWYLVHWPFAATCKHLEIADKYQLIGFYFATLILAEIVHFAYERVYLKWEKVTIGAVVLLLLLANGMAIYAIKLSMPEDIIIDPVVGMPSDFPMQEKLTTSFNYPSDFMNGWKGGYEGFSRECEVLARTNNGKGTYYDCSQDVFFMEAVKRVQPDVLFIIQRMFKMLEIVQGTNPFDDEVFKTASERLTEIQKYVKKRIFILDDFPETGAALSSSLEHLKSNYSIPELTRQSYKNIIGRMRIQRLASECPMCKVFDYTPQFFFNGKFKLYDPQWYVAFTSFGRHLTPAGHERVRPLVRHLCSRL